MGKIFLAIFFCVTVILFLNNLMTFLSSTLKALNVFSINNDVTSTRGKVRTETGEVG